ncbi:hypothetical protein Prudu_007903 [Prunus dulcis]|uniref:P-loop containing nucleoside triphosphate hydrolases superfamily protein n=1 Tax=Prunus dulcis TaxID=3755 RepID=A0A4Y1R301_PRUDU|nr:hypothetical protein Prudu_007903 [Prunus dulcis]
MEREHLNSNKRLQRQLSPGSQNDSVKGNYRKLLISMAGSTSTGGSGPSNPPKILLAKPGLVTGAPVAGKFGRAGTGDEYTTSLRSRLPSSIGSLNLLSDSWDFHIDRFLPFLTENTEFTVVGVIGPPGVGKSTIMNELYGFDATSPGMLPPFAIETEEGKAMARHCSMGIEPRVSAERLILLDTQMMRPDGSSTVPVLTTAESLSAELAHELMGIQVDLLKHGIPDPSSPTLSNSLSSNIGPEKDSRDKAHEGGEYMATPVFVHTKLRDHDLSPHNFVQLRKALAQYVSTSSFMRPENGNMSKSRDPDSMAPGTQSRYPDSLVPSLFVIPTKNKDDSPGDQYESYTSMLWKLRDKVLSMNSPPFGRTVSEREWLKNSAKIWELVKNSPIIAEYSRTLQSCGMFRR